MKARSWHKSNSKQASPNVSWTIIDIADLPMVLNAKGRHYLIKKQRNGCNGEVAI